MIAVSPSEMEIILKIIKKHIHDCDVLAFGYRLKWRHNDASDLDLAIVGSEQLSIGTLAEIKEDFMESDIPYKVDILDYHRISPAFRKVIDGGNERIYSRQE